MLILFGDYDNIINTIIVNVCVARNTYKTEELIWLTVRNVMPSSD